MLNPKGSGTLRVGIIAYCLMPNHFHFLLKMKSENGISSFLSDITNSYTKYINTKYERVGRLFQGSFKSKKIDSDESLINLSRYIHLNPIKSLKTQQYSFDTLHNYPYSSYAEWVGFTSKKFNNKALLNLNDLSSWIYLAGGIKRYQEFVQAGIPNRFEVGIEDLILE